MFFSDWLDDLDQMYHDAWFTCQWPTAVLVAAFFYIRTVSVLLGIRQLPRAGLGAGR